MGLIWVVDNSESWYDSDNWGGRVVKAIACAVDQTPGAYLWIDFTFKLSGVVFGMVGMVALANFYIAWQYIMVIKVIGIIFGLTWVVDNSDSWDNSYDWGGRVVEAVTYAVDLTLDTYSWIYIHV